LTHALEINAYLQQEKLHVNWVFSPRQLSPALVQSLADQFLNHLKALIEHCLSDDAGSKTVSDFDLLDISDDQFDQLAQMLGQLGK
jgi:non-ribosomal peptide synthase protein (TIGR01720 family)